MRSPMLMLLGALLLLIGGCRSHDRALWGSTARLVPSRLDARRSLATAVTDPQTWVPAVGALVFGLTSWDDDVADWARTETPLFGSNDTARDASNACVAAAGVFAAGTGLAAPSGRWGREIVRNKAQGAAVEFAAAGATTGLTYLLKDVVGRTRPNGADDTSFPSFHASLSASLAAMGRRNSEWLSLGRGARRAVDVGSTGVVALTAWARVEAGEHHPSDVLAGWALGNATSIFIHDAWLGRRSDWRVEMGWKRRTRAVTLGVEVDL